MNMKLPYYMAYPLPLVFDDERIDRRDYEYMKSMYPDMAKKMMPYIEDECDRYEYPNSMIYDEYPDKLQMRLMSKRIFEKVCANEKCFTSQLENWNKQDDNRNWLQNFIEVLLYQEMYRRRTDERRMRRKFY